MTHRECFQKVMAGEATEWVPNYELGCWGQATQRWLDEGMPPEGAEGNWFHGDTIFGLDHREFAYLHTGMIPGFPPQVVEETERYLVQRGANGVLTKGLKEGTVRGTRMCMDEYIDFPVKDRATWRDVKRRHDPADPARYPTDWDRLVERWSRRDHPVCLLGNGTYGLYSQLRSWVGTENVSYLFYDDPALVAEMIESHTDFLLGLIDRAVRDVRFDYFNFFEDCAGKGGPLFGPELFGKFFRKPYRRITDRLRRGGVESIWLDSDGDCRALIPLWQEVGVNCFWPLERASDMDPVELRRQFGGDIVLCGGVDKREIAKGPKAIDAELERLRPVVERGGYIPHIDHTVPPSVSYRDFLYYMERKRKIIGTAREE